MKSNSFILVFLISMFGSVFTALAYIYVQGLCLSPTDLAYGQGFLTTLSDPFVLTIAPGICIPIGVLSSPFLYFFLRYKNPLIVYPVIQVLVVIVISVLMPVRPGFALIGSLVTLLGSTLFFWRSPIG